MPKGEVSTRAIVLDAIAKGKQVFVPYIYGPPPNGVVERSRKIMEMVSVHSRDDYGSIENNRDAWGIPSVEGESVSERNTVFDDSIDTFQKVEDHGSSSTTPIEQNGISMCDLEMIVMPGVAFDRKCGRLGHGKGFYDTFLQRYHNDRATKADKGDTIRSSDEMPYLVGLALEEQLMPDDQEVPKGPSDWSLDALVIGDGTVIEAVL